MPVPSSPGTSTRKCLLLSVSWVSHQNGYRHDLAALADLAHAHGAYLYVDAIQGMGTVELDVTGVDFFAEAVTSGCLGVLALHLSMCGSVT